MTYRLTRRLLTRIVLSLALFAAVLAVPRPAQAGWRSLSGVLPAYTNLLYFQISPDSRTVAFVADIDTDDVFDLYAVPITGTAPLKLNPALPAGGDVSQFRFGFTPDSQAIIYLADQEVDNRAELFRVPVAGGASVKVSSALVAGGNVIDFKIAADTGRVVYTADQDTNEVIELWSVAGTGGGSTRLNGSFTLGGDIGLFDIDLLSGRVVYSADQVTDNKFELYSVPILGGSAVKLNPPITLAGGGDAGIYSDWAIDRVVPVVVFIAREAGAPGGRLYSIQTSGGVTPTKQSFNLLATQRLLNFKLSSTDTHVVFNVGTKDGSTFAFKGNLYANLLGQAGAANLTETADPLYGTDSYSILADGSRVVYSFQNDAGTPKRLESATMLGNRAVLYNPAGPGTELYNFRLSADSQWVLYQTGATYLAKSMYAVPPGGGSSTGFGTGEQFDALPNSSRSLYLRPTSPSGYSDLFSAQIFGGGERNLSRISGAGAVIAVQASPDSQWIVFGVSLDGGYDLRVSDGAHAPPPLYIPLVRR